MRGIARATGSVALILTAACQSERTMAPALPTGDARLDASIEGPFDAPLTLTQVGEPLDGIGPVGLAVVEMRGGTWVLVANHQNDDIRSLGIDPVTGHLTLLGTAATGDGPSAVAVNSKRRLVAVANLNSGDVTSLGLDPVTGHLTVLGTASSGGNGPSAIALSDDGYLIVANRDSDNLGVLHQDPASGALTLISTQAVGHGPADVKVSGRKVVVGHAISNDVHLLELGRDGFLYPLDSRPVGARVTSVAINRKLVAAGTYPDGDVHRFNLDPASGTLSPIGSVPTGGDITDIEFSDRGTLFVTGLTPARLDAFGVGRRGMQLVGSLTLTGLSSRTLATTKGPRRDTYVIVNEYNNNRTLVVSAGP